MSGNLPTQHTDTGQYSNMSDFGLMYYNARYYDPALGRFTSADTLIPNPGNPQSWDRYAYVRNNPIGRTDPTGHMDDDGSLYGSMTPDRRDLTRWLLRACIDSANSPEMQFLRHNNDAFFMKALVSPVLAALGSVGNMILFKSYVGDGKKYDVKDQIRSTLGFEIIILDDQAYEYSTAGNMLYGFYGRAAGYSSEILHAGAGVAQLSDHRRCGDEMGPLKTYMYDTVDDYYAVEFGIYLYDNYYDDGVLTELEMVTALRTFPDRDKLNHVPMPAYVPAIETYSVEEFYFGYEGKCAE